MSLEERIARLSPAQLAVLERKLNKVRTVAGTEVPLQNFTRNRHSPLSFAQERLWFLEQMEPESCVYNLPAIMSLRGPVRPDLVREAVARIVGRHSALRTRFPVEDGAPIQVIGDDPQKGFDFATVDLRSTSAAPLARTINEQI